MSASLQREIADYTARRDRLVSTILEFSDWLDRHQGMDAERNLRLLDTADALRKDRLTLAFVAEFSRGKTELINALFFADYGCRLLPSEAGRTTMCPAEIYFDPDEEPGLRVLPIESRLNADSLAHLKLKPIEWSRVKLDPDQPEQIARTLSMLSEVKRVAPADARVLGLWAENDLARISHEDGTVEIPAWRYAMLNLPHPLLKAGLAILDTPGLNALGAEPELTLSAIPSAHAVLFLLGADSGVTKSDLEIWQNHVQRHANFHVAVLNKIDMLWDEIRGDSETRAAIQRQLEDTARVLDLPINQVFGVSAQKALVGKVRKDADLIARSGVMSLEQVIGNTIIPARREIVAHAAVAEIGAMLDTERMRLAGRMRAIAQEWQDLSSLTGKSQEAIQKMRVRIVKDKERYDATADEFNETRRTVMLQGDELRQKLDAGGLEALLSEAHARMEGRWTTNGLIQNMRDVADRVRSRFSKASRLSNSVKNYLNQASERFHREHGLETMVIPALDLAAYDHRIKRLVQQTEIFCTDPANLLVEKRFMIRRFYGGVADEVRKAFGLAAKDAERWLRIALDPIMVRIIEHKALLASRLDNLKQTLDNMDKLKARMLELNSEATELKRQHSVLDGLAARLKD
ncbi:MAG TPA: dynamin family protein [Thiobacillaceae bacterium]|nr:dynamin family protein [Thiobacillaceae bacterium]